MMLTTLSPHSITTPNAHTTTLPKASTGMTTGSWFVLFKAEQCAHCKKLKPEFERLSQDESILEKGIVFATMDVPTNRLTSARFNVAGFPVLFYLHKGKVYKYKGQRMFDPLKTFLLETVDTLEGTAIPEPISGMTVMFRELQSTGKELYASMTGEHGMVGLAILAMVLIFFVIMGTLIGFCFWNGEIDSVRHGNKGSKRA
jgi:thiol-disulfide isomerase/thioredoxin